MPPSHFRPLSPRRRLWYTAGIFLLTLVASAAVFGGAAWLALRPLGQKAVPPSEDPPSNTAEDPLPTLHLLVVTAHEKQAESFLVVRMAPSDRTVSVTAVPRETEVAVGTSFATLQTLVGDGKRQGMEAVCEAISSLLSVPLSKYILFAGSDISSLLDYLGDGLVFSVPEPIAYEGTLSVRLNAGEQTLSPVQIQGLLSCPAAIFSGGRAQYAALRAALAAALYNQYAVSTRADSAEEDFKAAVNCASSTNLLISDFYAARDTIQTLRLLNEGDLCRSSVLPGSFVGRAEDVRFYYKE